MNCKEDTYKRNTSVIRHVFGNVLRLSVPLTRRVVDVIDGSGTAFDDDFYPNKSYPVVVTMSSGAKRYEYVASVDQYIITIEDKGMLPIGSYAITITCKDENANPMRFKAKMVLQIVDCTEDAQEGGIGWYDGIDGVTTYPALSRTTPTVIVPDDDGKSNINIRYDEATLSIIIE